MEDLYHQEYIKACRNLGLGDITLHHRKIKDEPLSKEDWHDVYLATIAYQFQLTLIVANARAREKTETLPKKHEVVQLYNPRSHKYVKVDKTVGGIIAHKRTPNPYKNIPIVARHVGKTENEVDKP